ncbi:MAG: COX15/CtaA family protein [Balneolaceae bacterium]|nr:COX15/CtaA family protein [Balneolaceae bacterium]
MIPQDKKHLRIWYWSGAIMVFLIMIIGGITRLTGSGLSIVDWRPIMGVIPPLTESQWHDLFEQYKQFPEYQQLNRGMTLSDFQFIFFWEYVHRMAARALGLVFIVPFAWFVIKQKLNRTQIIRALVLLGLGLSQALLGWYMVQSGLVDIPQVSPYRLASHLMLAFIIFGCCVWFALDLKPKPTVPKKSSGELRIWLNLFMVLLIIQIIWGAFVAGHHAGHVYNTFPKMHQYWLPPELWLMEPLFINFLENMVTVQWVHRVIGTFLGLMVILIWLRTWQLNSRFVTKKWALSLFALLLIQYAVGVFTLIYHVPVWLGVLHQALAMILFGVAIGFIHYLKGIKTESIE